MSKRGKEEMEDGSRGRSPSPPGSPRGTAAKRLRSSASAAATDGATSSSSASGPVLRRPGSNWVTPMLTDLYQVTMAYAYWHAGKQDEWAVFDLFFRKNPFGGEYTIFAGLDEVLALLGSYRFSAEQISALRARFPAWQPGFWDWMAKVDASKIKLYSIPQGTIVFPREPLLRVEGPLAVAQLLETTLLCLVNYPSLVCTNAARHRVAAGPDIELLEFGLRRAQGPDGAMSGTKYSIIGGFDGTSNVQAAIEYGTAMKGTHAHSFVVSFRSLDDLDPARRTLASADGQRSADLVEMAREKRKLMADLGSEGANEGELAAFVSYALAYPSGFLALVDTYDTLDSGVLNFLVVALCLHDLGYRAIGIRLDSGDLAYLSCESRRRFVQVSQKFGVPYLAKATIVASNDLSESVLYSLKEQGHEINAFGIGTNLVTCQAQPALGCVYKLVEISGHPRIKVSQDSAKVTIPCRKDVYRLYDSTGRPVLDLMTKVDDPVPTAGSRTLCRHPFDGNKRVYVVPSKVEQLLKLYWDGRLVEPMPTLDASKARVKEQVGNMREDYLRALNPTPYKVSISTSLFDFMHELLQNETPIREIA